MKYFKPEEFDCKCGKCGLGYKDMDPDHLVRLEAARGYAGIPFVITSAMRCAEHNRAEGGKPTSDHLTGHGTDVATPDSATRSAVITGAVMAGFTRIGVGKTFVHLGSSPRNPQNVVWLY